MATRAPRRLSKEDRRLQLVETAMELTARDGFAGVSLDELAARADVTRNLLYHYFPRGRQDLLLAVVDHAAIRLTDDWVTAPKVPRGERIARNFERMAEHALGPSNEWLVYRQGRSFGDPEVRAAAQQHIDRVVAAIALNNAGTAEPAPLVRLAILGFLSYAETALEEAREKKLPREDVLPVLAKTLAATVKAARG
jgi:AcrR family transcriptional regulator